MKISKIEKKVGIEIFFSPFNGVGGKLRTVPEDFIVNEISDFPKEEKNGNFTIAKITSINWETNTLVRELSNRLHISRQRICFAGTKDKRAKTTQLMSFQDVAFEKLSKLKIKDVAIDNIYRSNKNIRLGMLIGNDFVVKIRDINRHIKKENIEQIYNFILKSKGFPNFYGIQRFGIVRPNTHIVGKFIVKDDFEKGVMSYIANPMDAEDEEIRNLRSKLQDNCDFSSALKKYPNILNFERAILNQLVIKPEDFVGALKVLPKNLLMMFVYAYQSYLFNKILSERIRRDLPINEAIIGDIVLPIRKNIVDTKEILVNCNNIEKINKQIVKGKAVVSGLLYGYDSVFSQGEMGEIERKIIEKEKIEPRDFIIPDIPFISSSGSRRSLIASVKDFNYRFLNDDLNEGKKAVLLKFKLNKGSYATSLLRELMKSADIKDY